MQTTIHNFTQLYNTLRNSANDYKAFTTVYGKLYRTIMNELALRRDQRTNGLEFLKYVRSEIDRLESTEPPILPFAILRFNTQFANRDIEKPEITGDIDPVEINTATEDSELMEALPDSSSHFLSEPPESFEVVSPVKVAEKSSFLSTLSSIASAAASAVNFMPSLAHQISEPKPKERPIEPTTESATTAPVTTSPANVIVDMGVTTESNDMSYVLASTTAATAATAATDATSTTVAATNDSSPSDTTKTD
jgi:hypothetical protein